MSIVDADACTKFGSENIVRYPNAIIL